MDKPEHTTGAEATKRSLADKLKIPTIGAFIGMCSGALFSVVLPEKWINSNRFVRMTLRNGNAEIKVNRYANLRHAVWQSFLLGTLIGCAIDVTQQLKIIFSIANQHQEPFPLLPDDISARSLTTIVPIKGREGGKSLPTEAIQEGSPENTASTPQGEYNPSLRDRIKSERSIVQDTSRNRI